MEIAPADAGAVLAGVLEGTPAILVVAHPDDETIGLGGHLGEARGVCLLHLTNGAPRDPAFARAAGYDGPGAYARARANELDRALELAGVARERRRALGVDDGEVVYQVVEIVRAVRDLAREVRARVVLTHAYEGGHPDHDAAALACALAVRALSPSPVILEMPYYHRASGALAWSRFGPPRAPEHAVALSPDRLARKRAMLACFASQASVLAPLDPCVERFRVAPRHDFSRAPHEGALHYETLGWPITGAHFRERAHEAVRALAGDHP